MFLRRLTIKDIRSIVDVEVDFTSAGDESKIRPWTCLLGENGCGKSTILRAIALLLAGSDALPEIVGEVDRWIRNGKDTGQMGGILETQDGDQRSIKLEFKRGMTIGDLLKHNCKNLAALDAALKHTPRNYFVAGYGVSRRLSSRAHSFEQPEVFRNLRSQAVGTLFSGDAVLRSLDSWAMDLEYRRGKHGSDVIARATRDLLPGIKYHGIDKKKRRLMFHTIDGILPLEELSDGYQNVAAWCGDLLYRLTEVFENYKAPLNARGVLLLDEVDLHLHPVWQRQLVATLRERLPNLQFITTTHSPLTAQQAGEGELYILQREDGRPTLFHYEDAPNLLRIEQLIVSPVFGLETGVSVEVEKIRKKDELGQKLTKAEVQLLKSIPRRRADEKTEREKVELLKTVRDALEAAGVKSDAKTSLDSKPASFRPSASQVIRKAIKRRL